ncbi:MAG: hypothetical protein M3525_12435, partial [Acidobacteriota bacterium]|nr:hypothetical protein [Acidobacteriota bacterium]
SEYCEKLSQLVPAELKSKFIDRFTLTLEDVGFLGAHWELSKLVREKKTLKHIIQAYQHAKKKDLGIETNFAFGKPLDTFSFNSDSTFKMTGFQVIELLKKHKIPIKRLLECPVCLKIVWVKTTRAETCGEKKCSDELGNRKRLAAAKALKEKQDNHFKSRVEK